MSHYSVMVLTDENTQVDELLAPFDEEIIVEPYIKMTKQQIIEEQKKEIEDYRTTGCYAKYLENPELYKEKHKNNPEHLNYVENIFPKKLSFTDEELYQDYIQYYGADEITEDGSIISTYNPKSKWDWYVEGGRFSNMLKLKEDGSLVNSAYAREIDFSVIQEDYNNAIRFWEVYVEGQEPQTEEEKSYISYIRKEYYIDRYKAKENYAKHCATIHTYAVLTPDGNWFEPGKMGWFGVSHAKVEEEIEFEKNFDKYIQMAIENDWMITIVDCHI